ncbi:Mbov_0392 family ICE element protein [[Mycoplasma] collis]|uniref:Mbov_0392 family ICE element protein n=1 Tax=[Mycoplasma] collis TaxID=2127 RepID=UPI00051B14D0|nr:hypothetical protein [[Mycoplasma] collis]
MENYKNLNDYCFNNLELNNKKELKATQLINQIMKVDVDELLNYLRDLEDFNDFLNINQIYKSDFLWEMVNDSLKEEGMKSDFLFLANDLNKNFYADDWVEVDQDLEYFQSIDEKEFIKNYLNKIDEEKLIEIHQYFNELIKEKLWK